MSHDQRMIVASVHAVRSGQKALPPAATPTLPRIDETSLYVSDLSAARDFYAHVLGLEIMLNSSRLLALRGGGLSVLLLLHRCAPPDRDDGSQQLSFVIAVDSVTAWIDRIQAAGVSIEQRKTSPRGSESICIRDPDGHAVELITPGLWSHDEAPQRSHRAPSRSE